MTLRSKRDRILGKILLDAFQIDRKILAVKVDVKIREIAACFGISLGIGSENMRCVDGRIVVLLKEIGFYRYWKSIDQQESPDESILRFAPRFGDSRQYVGAEQRRTGTHQLFERRRDVDRFIHRPR